jgi:hypothetical protein
MRYPFKSRRATTLVFVICSISVFLLMTAIAVDIGYLQLAKTQLRAASDAASKAGTEALSRLESRDAAVKAAKEFAAANEVNGEPLILTDKQIEVGHAKCKEDGSWEFKPNKKPFTSVQITVEKPVALFFGGVTGNSQFFTSLSSTAAFTRNEICLVIDRSHSMCFDLTGNDWVYPAATPTSPDEICYPPDPTDSRWAALALSIEEFVAVVAARGNANQLGMVTFGSNITRHSYQGRLTGRSFPEVVTDVELTSDFSEVTSAITARGNDIMLGATNLGSGMTEGMKLLSGPKTKKTSEKTMIVMTDGKWNQGANPEVIAMEAKKENITIYTVTFLDKADQTSMKNVAKIGGGHHYHASDQASLVKAFRELALRIPVTLVE